MFVWIKEKDKQIEELQEELQFQLEIIDLQEKENNELKQKIERLENQLETYKLLHEARKKKIETKFPKLVVTVDDKNNTRIYMDGKEVQGWRYFELEAGIDIATTHKIEYLTMRGGLKK